LAKVKGAVIKNDKKLAQPVICNSLLNYKKIQKSLSSTALHFPLSLSLSLIFLLCLISYCGLLTWTVDAPVVADLAWGGEELVGFDSGVGVVIGFWVFVAIWIR
jgi:hypothetical protein